MNAIHRFWAWLKSSAPSPFACRFCGYGPLHQEHDRICPDCENDMDGYVL